MCHNVPEFTEKVDSSNVLVFFAQLCMWADIVLWKFTIHKVCLLLRLTT